jgi:hypothetical protein
MLELLAAAIALAFQLVYEVAVFLLWDVPRWLLKQRRTRATVAHVLKAEDAIAALAAQGFDYSAASVAVVEQMQKRNAIDALVSMGMSKADAGVIARASLKAQKRTA